ncbi:hypothetical protein B0H19DRAFT_1070365 [Mycena capillaripes]|nr:hypothetical protein B0H19DRAFT_1070365 [Mycena capillaripes]
MYCGKVVTIEVRQNAITLNCTAGKRLPVTPREQTWVLSYESLIAQFTSLPFWSVFYPWGKFAAPVRRCRRKVVLGWTLVDLVQVVPVTAQLIPASRDRGDVTRSVQTPIHGRAVAFPGAPLVEAFTFTTGFMDGRVKKTRLTNVLIGGISKRVSFQKLAALGSSVLRAARVFVWQQSYKRNEEDIGGVRKKSVVNPSAEADPSAPHKPGTCPTAPSGIRIATKWGNEAIIRVN